jgi:uncharacterized membrane protein
LLVYWANIFVLGAILFGSWKYAVRAGLTKADLPAGIGKAVERRILVAQALYAGGAALCVVDPWVSVGFIVLVQMNFDVAPGFRCLSGV